MKDLNDLVRPDIWALQPYGSVRGEHDGQDVRVLLDANENPYNSPLNRYPDPLQTELRLKLAQVKGVPADCVFLGNGSDESVDLCYRVFCTPYVDNVVAIEPTCDIYKVRAAINGVGYRPVLLDDSFQISASRLLAACDSHTKLIWICSPNNPTGNNMLCEEVEKVLRGFDGIVVIDEAYSDFSRQRPFRSRMGEFPNMIVLNTFSKAWGCAAIHLGMAFAGKDIVGLFDKVRCPWNVNALTQRQALDALADRHRVHEWVNRLLQERARVMRAFCELPFCVQVYPSDANFFLAKMADAQAVYDYLVSLGIVVGNCTRVALCRDCLRVTIGAVGENTELIGALRRWNR